MSAPQNTPRNIVVVGGGLAGAKAVEGLRERGYDGDITLFGAESHLPYERPPLSKGLLLGSDEPDSVFVHDQAWYDDQRVDLRTGVEVTALDLDRRRVTAGGTETAYDRLLLATGSAPRRLPVADAAACRWPTCARSTTRSRSRSTSAAAWC